MALTGIRVEGGLLGPDLLVQIAQGEVPGQTAADFGLAAGTRVLDEISRSWNDAKDYWSVFKRRQDRLSQNDPHGTTLTRQQWISRLLDELLGYGLTLLRPAPVIDEHSYPISHRAGAGETDPPVHVVGFKVDLDHRDPEAGRRLSTQALVQEYINRDEEQLWGIATNGLQLRLLRDTARATKPTFVEFDLVGILDGDRFNEFAVFYRLCHRSRLPKAAQPPDQCWLERYYQDSVEQGGRARDKLRDGVEDALKILGTKFLRHPRNDALAEQVRNGSLTPPDLYRQLLRLVYRLLFLMVAEERGMILAAGDAAGRKQRIYDRYYSVTRLRERAAAIIESSSYDDLWASLRQTFAMLANGGQTNRLGIPPLNGDLFAPNVAPDLLGAELHNDALLLAVRRLALFRDGDVLRRVNYGALDVEELGSVYESLLERHPAIVEREGGLAFDLLAGGGEKKSTGSYYTRPELVHELIRSALVPVLTKRMGTAAGAEGKERAILGLTVCDPACGSGHFLLAAARQIGRELAKVRTDEEEPTPTEFRRAVRDVIQHCVYGVDLNPLAVDLCRLALWIEGHYAGLPLTFLDHRIKCGNSLVGLFSLEILNGGVPDEAFTAVFGDDKGIARNIRRRNETERKAAGTQVQLLAGSAREEFVDLAVTHGAIADLPEATVADIHEKARQYIAIRGKGAPWWTDWTAANLWTSAFFTPLDKTEARLVATTRELRDFLEGHGDAQKAEVANRLGRMLRFFHWPLEFPEVFARGGFDVVVGNPPWERIKLQEEEFFAARDQQIAEAPRKADREQLIKELPKKNQALYQEYVSTKHMAEAQSKYVRAGSRYPLTAVGDINTYALFAELARSLIAPAGRSGLVVPTGVATDDTCKEFFGHLVAQRELESLYDFENRRRLFPGVDSRYKFCLLTMSRQPVELAKFAFFLQQVEDLADDRRRISMPPGDLVLFNPNTRTCPMFRTRMDGQLARKIYTAVPILVSDDLSRDPWGISFLQMFHMTNDSHLLSRQRGKEMLPVWEAKMTEFFDHRYANIRFNPKNPVRQAQPEVVPDAFKGDPNFLPDALNYVANDEVARRWPATWHHRWIPVFKRVTASTNHRTLVPCVVPKVGLSYTLVGIATATPPDQTVCLLACLGSLVCDWLVRQKTQQPSLPQFCVEQTPVLAPEIFEKQDVRFLGARILELVYTATDLQAFAVDLGYHGAPFTFIPNRRAILRAEVDAYIAHLYGLSRDELRYILDPKDLYGPDFPGETFRVLKEREETEYGEYRTRRLVLEVYDELTKTGRFGRLAVTKPADG